MRLSLVSGSSALVFSLVALLPSAEAQVLAPNLLYTSVQPCRVFDTRTATAGELVVNVTRTFNIVGNTSSDFTSQGGHAGGCSIPGFQAGTPQVQAVVLNFVAVGSAGAGDLVAWPSDQAAPSSSVINYAIAGSPGRLNIANGIVLPIRQDTQGGDLSVVAQVSRTHVLADVVGYFSSSSPLTNGGSGTNNLFLGQGAGGVSASTASFNTSFGPQTIAGLTSGLRNTAIGNQALFGVTSGSENVGVGDEAGFGLTSGVFNVAVGSGALAACLTGQSNTAVGPTAMKKATSGDENVAIGSQELENLINGNFNTALGSGAGFAYAGAESSNILVGSEGVVGDQDTIRIGDSAAKTFIAGVSANVGSGTPLVVAASGQIGITTSSLRFKEDIESMGEASDALLKLRPVTYHYRANLDDGSHLLQYGLVAEEVAEVYPGLVQYGKDGQPLTVRYQFVNVMLLNEVQKAHVRLEEQEAKIRSQEAQISDLTSQLASQSRDLTALHGLSEADRVQSVALLQSLASRVAELEQRSVNGSAAHN
jgi:hypothetical protein